jgi:hypothetical protein
MKMASANDAPFSELRVARADPVSETVFAVGIEIA